MNTASIARDRIVELVGDSGFGARGVHVLVGRDEATHAWGPQGRVDVQSVAKAVCVLAAGIAEEAGLIDADAPVGELLPGTPLGAGVDRVTLRHLLSMSSGIDLAWSETMMTDWPDLAVEFLGRPAATHLDGRGPFQYSNASTYTAMRALAARVGDIAEFLEPSLFEPLGIVDVEWERCPNGYVVGGGGLFLTTAELARLGRLIRDRGAIGTRQLVPAGWVDAMHSEWVVAGDVVGYERYALAGWDGPGRAWRLHGAYGQLVIFVGDAVVTVTAEDHFGADAFAASVVEILERS